MNWLSTCDMFSVKSVVIFIILSVACGCEGRKLYEDSQNDEDDSMDCNDGRKIDDPILLPFLQKLRGQEMLPARMKEWVVYFDDKDVSDLFNGWSKSYLTEVGLSKEDQGVPYGCVYVNEGANVYVPRLTPIQDDWTEFRVMYAEQLLLDSIDKVKLYIKYDLQMGELSKSSTRLLQVLLKRARPQTITTLSSSCNASCKPDAVNPLLTLATCGYVYDKKYDIQCDKPADTFAGNFFEGTEASHFEKSITPEYQVGLPVQLKQELQNILDWLLKRIGQRMRNYMEMAFKKNRFRKTNMDLYNKVNLQISKIKGGRTFEAAKSADLIYNSLFDLNVYLNVTNTPYTFDKFHTFNLYLGYIGQFSKWQLDTTKYANFFEPLKELCLSQINVGNNLLTKATSIFELEEGVYDLTGVICHENILYVINGMTNINTIKSGLFDNENCDFDTVFVLAKKNLTINEDLKIPGKNLIVFAPTWIIFKNQVIDLSGKNGGSDRVESGQSGGDFFGYGLRFDRPDFLTFVTNGGDGSRGRNASAVVSDDRFTKETGGKCVTVKEKEKEILSEYGATQGGPGGSAGTVTLKILRNPVQNYTVVRKDGKDGRSGKIRDITFQCENKKQATLSVHDLTEINIPANDIQRMNESSILELFRKIIRKNSRRLSFDVLSFYKDIWTSPIIGETLDSTLNDFLNSTDYTESSKDFYEITSQILHTQIKQTCNMTETQKILLDFALATIRMTAPAENALPSVIDITSYLKEVSNSVKRKDIEDEYFERKDEKFRKIIEEANYYLKASLLPSLNRSIADTHQYLKDNADGYLVKGNFSEGRKFQENLVSNSLLRYLTKILKHVQLSLEDFVQKEEFDPSAGTRVGESDEAKLEKKLYFYRYLRNNVTVNEMNAMIEFIKLLKKVADDEAVTNKNACSGCKRELSNVVNELRNTLQKSPDRCEKCINIVKDDTKHRKKRSAEAYESCAECDGDCLRCWWCESCQEQCNVCTSCMDCPWCSDCREKEMTSCRNCRDCAICPECPQCIKNRPTLALRTFCAGEVDCSQLPFCPQCGEEDICDSCDDCLRCPQCKKCEDDPCTFCMDCQYCPECPRCMFDQKCPTCRDCNQCPNCPQCCEACNDCSLCPQCLKCSDFTSLEACEPCDDCSLCPQCSKCRNDLCDTCADCQQCPECSMCQDVLDVDVCEYCPCDECPFCLKCQQRTFDEIEAGLIWTRNYLRNIFELAQMDDAYRSEDGSLDLCENCSCGQCPFCPDCQKQGFDEIEAGLVGSFGKSRNELEHERDSQVNSAKRSNKDGLDDCENCPCEDCPFCPKCDNWRFDEIEAGLIGSFGKSGKESELERKSETYSAEGSEEERFDQCDYCSCEECPYCPRCMQRKFDEIEAGLIWTRSNLGNMLELMRNLKVDDAASLNDGGWYTCANCSCKDCPYCPRCMQRKFDEAEAGLRGSLYQSRNVFEHERNSQIYSGERSNKEGLDDCENCSCEDCPFCPKCDTWRFDEIEAGLIGSFGKSGKESELERKSETYSAEGSEEERFDQCDYCSCEECPYCPRCMQRKFDEAEAGLRGSLYQSRNMFEHERNSQIYSGERSNKEGLDDCENCPCEDCPFCPKCDNWRFDEIEAGLIGSFGKSGKESELERKSETYSAEGSEEERFDQCDYCSCEECPYCPRCMQRKFDEIKAGLIWTRSNLGNMLELMRNLKVDGAATLNDGDSDICGHCSCKDCPYCPGCAVVGFDEIEAGLIGSLGQSRSMLEHERNSEINGAKRSEEGNFDLCEDCSCDQCPFCPKCHQRKFDEIEAGLIWTRNNLRNMLELVRNLQVDRAERSEELRSDLCENCSCDQCPFCIKCHQRKFDEIEAGLIWTRGNLRNMLELVRNLQVDRAERSEELRSDLCENCSCDQCPFCPKCQQRKFDEIEAGLIWTRRNLRNILQMVRDSQVNGVKRTNREGLDNCVNCPCDECSLCPHCERQGFDEIEAGLVGSFGKSRNKLEHERNSQVNSAKRSNKDGLDDCENCPCDESPLCSDCEKQGFDEIEAGLVGSFGKSRNESEDEQNSQVDDDDAELDDGILYTCDNCSCMDCPYCPGCAVVGFDEIEAGLIGTFGHVTNALELERKSETYSAEGSEEERFDQCDYCSCEQCPYCPRCMQRNFDEIEAGLIWTRSNLRNMLELVRNLQMDRAEGSEEERFDQCDYCSCEECPYCPRCMQRNFDEIEAGLIWTRSNLRNMLELVRNLHMDRAERSEELRSDLCENCSCDQCPFCPQCHQRKFDEIKAGLIWTRSNLGNMLEMVRNLQMDRAERSEELSSVNSENRSRVGCPVCSDCDRQGFDEIEAGLVGSFGKSRNELEHERDSQVNSAKRSNKDGLDDCENCPCNECPFCPDCDNRRFDEIEAGLIGSFGKSRKLLQLARNSQIDGAERSQEGGFDNCEYCPCDECPYCPKCENQASSDVENRLFGTRKTLRNAKKDDGLRNQEKRNALKDTLRVRDNSAHRFGNSNVYKQSSLQEKSKSRRKYEIDDESSCDTNGQYECQQLPSSSGQSCVDCMSIVENYKREVDSLITADGEHCNAETEKFCKDTVQIVRRIMPEFRNLSENGKGTGYDSVLLLKCSDCNDTLDFFTDKLNAEISRCAQESNYNYREVDSKCSANEGIFFHMKGCDPETFSRTFDEIRENFLKEFSQFVTADQQHSHELDHIQSNFGYLLTNIDMLLQEGITLSGASLNNVLYVTDALIKFKDLKMEYQKRMTELHDFSETDMYDLFNSELSMQNERLGMTSKWLNQLKKLLPWMKKVTRFLGVNPKFQEVNERIREAIRLVSEIGHNVKLVERHRELRNYIKRVRVIEKKEKTTGIGKAILDLKTSFQNTFIRDVFHKAVTMAQNWVFPLTKSYLAIQKIKNNTYGGHLAAVSAEIEEYRKSIMLYTTIHAFDSTKNDVPFYEWNVRTRPTLLHDLFNGKPVILVSEILDGGKKNSLMAKDFEVKFVAGQRQVPGTQEQIDDALKGFWLNLTHSGISYFKFGSRIYRRLTETFTFRHTASTVDREKVKSSLDYVLSPYTTWVLRLEPDSAGKYPLQIQDKIGSIELVGTGRYVINCADITDVNQYFIPLNDYNRRNEK